MLFESENFQFFKQNLNYSLIKYVSFVLKEVVS